MAGSKQSDASNGVRQFKQGKLTPAQLERKRKSDRDNQRAMRARNKARIQELEDMVERLTGQLQQSESKWRALQTETQTVYKAANTFVEVMGRMQSQIIPSEQSELMDTLSCRDNSTVTSKLGAIQGTSPLPAGSSIPLKATCFCQNRTRTETTTETRPMDSNLDSISNDQDIFSSVNIHAAETSQPGYLETLDLEQMRSDVAARLPSLINSPTQCDINSDDFIADELSGLHDFVFHLAAPLYEPPIWTILPAISTPTVAIDQGLEHIFRINNQLQPSDLSTEMSSSIATAVTEALTPGPKGTMFPICTLVVKWMISNFGSDFSSDFVNFVGVLYSVYVMVRWRVAPTEANYRDVPNWMKPNRIQLQKRHAAWMDCFPWPDGRAELIKSFDNSLFDIFSQTCTKTVSMNWPWGSESVLVWCSTQNRMTLNPSYEAHIKMLDNWTIGISLMEKFPALTGLIKCKSAPVGFQTLRRDIEAEI